MRPRGVWYGSSAVAGSVPAISMGPAPLSGRANPAIIDLAMSLWFRLRLALALIAADHYGAGRCRFRFLRQRPHGRLVLSSPLG
jgi:hypothetical protein